MAKVDLKIKSTTPTAQSQTTTISYVNPALTNEQLSTLGHTLNALTDNHYDESQKVTTVNVDSEDDKQTPTILSAKTITSALKGEVFTMPSGYTGSAPVYICNQTSINFNINLQSKDFVVMVPSSLAAGTYSIPMYAPETTVYNALNKDFVFTVE